MLTALKPTLGSTLNRSHPLARGLVLCWLLNERAGTRANDLAGNTPGVLTLGPLWQSGPYGPSVYTDGSDDHIITSTLTALGSMNTSPFSFGCRFMPRTSVGTAQTVMCISNNGSNTNALYIEIRSSTIVFEKGGPTALATSTVTPVVGKWYTALCTFDGTTPTIYVNGVQTVGSGTPVSIIPINVLLGRYFAGAFFDPFGGQVDMGCVWNRALNTREGIDFSNNPTDFILTPPKRRAFLPLKKLSLFPAASVQWQWVDNLNVIPDSTNWVAVSAGNAYPTDQGAPGGGGDSAGDTGLTSVGLGTQTDIMTFASTSAIGSGTVKNIRVYFLFDETFGPGTVSANLTIGGSAQGSQNMVTGNSGSLMWYSCVWNGSWTQTQLNAASISFSTSSASVIYLDSINLVAVYIPGSAGTNYTRSFGDNVGITDAMSRVAAYSRSLADSEGTTDLMARLAAYARTLADSEGVTDLMARAAAYLRSLSDAVGVTDLMARTAAYLRTQSDGVGVADLLARAAAYSRSIADPEGVTDLMSRAAVYLRTQSDGVGSTDALGKAAAYLRSLTDPEGVTDGMSPVSVFARAIADAVGITDITSKTGGFVRVFADAMGVTDVVTYLNAIVMVLADSMGISDALSRTVGYSRSQADSMGLSDALSRTAGYTRAHADPVGITDAISAAMVYIRVQNDAVGVTDAFSRVATYLRTLPDTMGLSDVASRAVAYIRQLADYEGLTDRQVTQLNANILALMYTLTVQAMIQSVTGLGPIVKDKPSINPPTDSDTGIGKARP